MSKLTCSETARWLLTRDNILILTHIRPDGDTVGCAAGLCTALREQGKCAFILPNPGASSLYVPYIEGLLAGHDFVPDTVVAVDIAAQSMFPDNARGYLDRVDLAIDHHPSQAFFAVNTCLDAERASCGEIIYEIVCQWGAVSRAVALPLYVAVSTDCGCFMYNNTTAETHRVAAALIDTGIDIYPVNHKFFRTKSAKRMKLESMLVSGMQLFDGGRGATVTLTLDMIESTGAGEEDMDNISAFVGQIEGVCIGVTVRQLSPTQCKISLRTDPNVLNASAVCALLGGGGHAAAAGATIDGTPQQAADAVLAAIKVVQNAE